FFFQAEDGIRDYKVTGVQTCALPIYLIVDVQCEFKSALAARLARGPRCGYDSGSAREWGAHLMYQKRFFVVKGQHSIERMRQLRSEERRVGKEGRTRRLRGE